MTIAHSYHDLHSEKIFVRDFYEKVDVKQIIDSWKILLEQNMITDKTVGVLNNFIQCKLEMNMDSFHTLTSFLSGNERLRKLKQAVVCDDPKTIVFPTLAEEQEKKLKIKLFTTEDAALLWLLSEE